MTSTCAPRLRVGNGFRVYHYSSALLHEHLLGEGKDELWEVAWRNEQNCPDFNVSYAKVQGIQPKHAQASKVLQYRVVHLVEDNFLMTLQ